MGGGIAPEDSEEDNTPDSVTIPDKPALDIAIHGTPSDCIEQVDRFRKEGCQEFMLTFTPEGGLWSTKNLVPMVRLFSAKVMSYFRDT